MKRFTQMTVVFSEYKEEHGVATAKMVVDGKMSNRDFRLSCVIERAVHNFDGSGHIVTAMGLGGGGTEFGDAEATIDGKKAKDIFPILAGCYDTLKAEQRGFASYIAEHHRKSS